MNDFLARVSKLSPQRLALLANQLNDRLEALEENRSAPIAIVGMGCRFPGGVHDAESFWKLLSEGVDAIREVPSDRWNIDEFYDRNPDTPGKMATRCGGFIDGPDQFDPKFFGIAPAEAAPMDPQQRLLLESVWEALENAGIAPSTLAGSQTGVFVGICNSDYGNLALRASREKITPYFASGLSHAIAAGRISYLLGLEGTSLAVDTSCSASLMAVHLACQSLRLKESHLALAGGVNLILSPDVTIALSQSHMMSQDGRCKAFSDDADGFVRSEGSGMIVLKRLDDAMRDRNRILAVIRGTAANQDGRSSGLTAPNGRSQEAVVRAALADAGMGPDDIQYIEAHGTGTALGDPIEIGALGNVFAERSPAAEPVRVGSVKSNVGHMESAAGVAGLMKLVLSLQHKEIPASLHCHQPNHRIEWGSLPIRLSKQKESWPSCDGKRAGGVSSFGFSGTNVHVIVEEHLEGDNPPEPSGPASERPLLFPLSAKSEAALRSVAARLNSHLGDHTDQSLPEVARTLNIGRSNFSHRFAVTASSREELRKALTDFENSAMQKLEAGQVAGHSVRIGFLFADHEFVYTNTGRALYEEVPRFREIVNRCEDILLSEIGHPLTSLMYPKSSDGSTHLAREIMPAASFAVQYALAEVWRSCGLDPAFVLGSGTGECIAACFAGVITTEDALRLLVEHGKENLPNVNGFAPEISSNTQQVPWFTSKSEEGEGEPLWLRNARAASASLPFSELGTESCSAYLSMAHQSVFQEQAKRLGIELPGKSFVSMQDNVGDLRAFTQAAAALYLRGCELDLSTFYRKIPARTVSLPTYPFERERYWLEVEKGRDSAQPSVANPDRDTPRLRPSGVTNDWLYELVWESRSQPVNATDNYKENFSQLLDDVAVPPPSEVALHVTEASERFQVICSAYALKALEELGLKRSTDEFTLDGLCHDLKIARGRERIVSRMLGILAEDGIIERKGNVYRFLDLEKKPDPDSALSVFAALNPEVQTELEILRRCTHGTPDVLLGTQDPMQLVFAGGSVQEAEQIYQNSPVCRYFNDAVRDIVTSAVGQITGRTVKILEIGAGTGATTASVLPAIANKNIEYAFTDISPVFLSKARDKFKDISGVDYRLLNIEHAPVEQGFEASAYDIVLAANVLHATADLRQTIMHTRQLLRPGGLLIIIEGVRPDRWLDLTFGLTDGWWRFVDHDLRPEHPLISCEKWQEIFHQHGMGSSRTIGYETKAGNPSQQVLMLACADANEPHASSGADSRRRWLIFSDQSGVGSSLEKLLRDGGENCELVHQSHFSDEPELALQAVRQRWRDDTIEVVYLWGLDAVEFTDLDRNIQMCAQVPIRLMRSLAQQEKGKANLWLVTRGAQATDSYAPLPAGALQSMLWGAGRVFGLEHPDRYRRLIDLDPERTCEEVAADLLSEFLKEDVEDQIAHRAGGRLVPRVKRTTPATLGGTSNKLRPDASYLIIGGFGRVGRQLTRWAAEAGAGHLVLLGRSGLEPSSSTSDRAQFVEEIRALGVGVTVVAGDVASTETMERVFGLFGKECPEVRGIFQAATAQSIADLSQLSEKQVSEMLRPKVLGTWLLHEWTKHRQLDFLISFSSTTSLLGSRGMAHYAAANQFLDNFAYSRRAQGLPMLSVNWGAWYEVQDGSANARSHLRQMGLLAMDAAAALGWMPQLTSSSRANVIIADVDWRTLKAIYEARRVRPMLADVGTNKAISDFASDDLPLISSMGQEERVKFVEQSIISASAKVLGFRAGETPPVDIPLTDLGLDSLMAVDLRNRLQTTFGRELPPTIVFDYPTISGLVQMLETMMWAASSGDSRNAPRVQDEIHL